ncbi:MAG: hypothetical protein NZ959_01070 [Armatimonadetes bacterium]|nr:hypothetical protein [Armatimonadota bacterium]MDW8121896.1 hypothetical protein [Armatimonadota bacterium]
MRVFVFTTIGLLLAILLSGCERLTGAKEGEEITVPLRPPRLAEAPVPSPPPTPPGQPSPSPQPTQPDQPTPLAEQQPPTPPTSPTQPAPPAAPSQPAETPQPVSEAKEPATQAPQQPLLQEAAEKPQRPTPAPSPLPAVATEPLRMTWDPAVELRNLRATIDVLCSDLKKPAANVKEVQERLLFALEWLSEVETRWPSLALWRTWQRLRSLSQSPVPDTRSAAFWLEQLMAMAPQDRIIRDLATKTKNLINRNQWTQGLTVLDQEVQARQVSEILSYLIKVRGSLWAAWQAIGEAKTGVARAELEEAMRAIDRLLYR